MKTLTQSGLRVLRPPMTADGAAMWQLVKDTGILDLNSSYLYLLVCRDFAATSVVMYEGDQLVGLITGYQPPNRPDHLFVWQVGVDDRCRGQGLAGQMLDHLVARVRPRFVETTVSPSNQASLRLFQKLATRHETDINSRDGFAKPLFPGDTHEAEPTLLIGPFAHGSDHKEV